MALYQYTTDDDSDSFERTFPIGTAPRTIAHAGRTYFLDFRVNNTKPKEQKCTGSVVISNALGVHPSQIPEAREFDRRHNLKGVEYLKDGSVRIEGRAARKAYCEAHGFYDRNGGYGDPQRKGRAYHGLPELPKPRFRR